MTDFEHILPLWNELEASETDYVLATIVAVEGSSYRRPGARMLMAPDGRRAGTVSGGCLEGEVARRAWWLTENGPVVERYSTLEDDGDLPYGSGCGGVVHILLERRETASPLLHALKVAFDARQPLAIATILEGRDIGTRTFAGTTAAAGSAETASQQHDQKKMRIGAALSDIAQKAFEARRSSEDIIPVSGVLTRVWADYRSPRPGLWVFGAGDDAKPLVKFARELGWFVAVADGRAHLATATRFPHADRVLPLAINTLPSSAQKDLAPLPSDAVALLTHSFEQDARILAFLLRDSHEFQQTYVGVLGPQRRTREALAEATRLLDMAPNPEREDHWLARVYAPIGIDLGADTPASIALSILAEIQQTLSAATALPLRQVRATRVAVAQD